MEHLMSKPSWAAPLRDAPDDKVGRLRHQNDIPRTASIHLALGLARPHAK